jgi:osmotically-inducible protein OsmY
MSTNKSDSQIQSEVLEELKWDTRVNETEVGVQVRHGIVTLTGTVATFAKRLAARDAAHRVAGVHDVADDLLVQPYAPAKRNDTEIAEVVRTALKLHVLVPEHRIQTTISNGAVTLSGSVDHAWQRDEAARVVGHLEGVCALSNEIKVVAPSVSPAVLRAAIEGALERHATREAKKVKLDIEGSKVRVSGNVDSFADRQAILGAVWGTCGVEIVIDQTRIG